MAKLYAEIDSDRGGRVASKGGNDELRIIIKCGNDVVYRLRVNELGMLSHMSATGENLGSLLWKEYQAHNMRKKEAIGTQHSAK